MYVCEWAIDWIQEGRSDRKSQVRNGVSEGENVKGRKEIGKQFVNEEED
jgi:hypothetical protein